MNLLGTISFEHTVYFLPAISVPNSKKRIFYKYFYHFQNLGVTKESHELHEEYMKFKKFEEV